MAAVLKRAVPEVEIELVAGGKGDFIVSADGVELWNKRAMGDEFPNGDTLLARLKPPG
ncbi:MAG: hypothetical protein HYV07_11250 [Deltaproteobacteria bacterium]|nr:hypothetical protein [Deltaproteobacteria bacterium]